MFVWIDGNKTGEKLWQLLAKPDGSRQLAEAANFSQNINLARELLKSEVLAIGATVILDGGDDLLFWVDDDVCIDMEILRTMYFKKTGTTCKIVQGNTLRETAESMKQLKTRNLP